MKRIMHARIAEPGCRKPFLKAVKLLGIAAVCLVFLFPVLWILSVSVRSEKAVFETALAVKEWHFENYAAAWKTFGFSSMFLNSLVVTAASIAATLVISALAGYAFAKLRYRGSDAVYIVLLTGIMIPQAGILIAFFFLTKEMGLYNTLAAVVIACVAFGIPLSVMLFRGFFAGLPNEILEAARVDGCREAGIFFRICLPLCKPAVATTVIMLFVTNWNDYLMPLVLLRSEQKFTLPLGIARYVGQWNSPWNLIAAGVVICAVPITVVYLAFQSQFVKGLTAGAVKG